MFTSIMRQVGARESRQISASSIHTWKTLYSNTVIAEVHVPFALTIDCSDSSITA